MSNCVLCFDTHDPKRSDANNWRVTIRLKPQGVLIPTWDKIFVSGVMMDHNTVKMTRPKIGGGIIRGGRSPKIDGSTANKN